MTWLSTDAERRNLQGTIQDRVAHTLRQEILAGRLPPGTRLRQTEVATRMGVSTTPVREALRVLATEGLVEEKPHRGFEVRRASPQELEEIYELRLILEPLNTKAAVGAISAAEMEVAEELVTRMDHAEDTATWVELNREFHRVLTEGSRRRRTVEILQSLQNNAALYVGVFAQEATHELAVANEEHRAILDAFRERDEERAAELVAVHLRHSSGVVLDFLEGEGAETRG